MNDATATATMTPDDLLGHLWQQAGLPRACLDAIELNLSAPAAGPSVPSTFKVGLLAQATIASVACAQVLLEELQRGDATSVLQRLRGRKVQVDQREALLEFASEKHTRVVRNDTEDGVSDMGVSSELFARSHHITSPEAFELLDLPRDALPSEWDALAGVYPCRDGYVRLHTNFPHHKAGLLRILSLLPTLASSTTSTQVRAGDVTSAVTAEMEEVTRQQVGEALKRWGKLEFEQVAREQGMCATAFRSEEEWDATEQGTLTKGLPALQVQSVEARGSHQPEQHLHTARPLRVIDMSRVIAAPVAGRALAAHGHAVTLLSSPQLPNLPILEADTMRGKQTQWLDLDHEGGKAALRSRIEQSDVFLQSYRPGGLSSRGFGVDDVLRLRPGLIYATLSAYGGAEQSAPWSEVRGFDSLVQNATGINHSEGMAFQQYKDGGQAHEANVEPKPLPVQALDHAAGYLLALGILAARCRQLLSVQEDSMDDVGHGYTVRVSLASVAQLLRSLGRYTAEEAFGTAAPPPLPSHTSREITEHLVATPVRDEAGVGQGRLFSLGIRHAAKVDGTRRRWDAVPAKLGVDGALLAGRG